MPQFSFSSDQTQVSSRGQGRNNSEAMLCSCRSCWLFFFFKMTVNRYCVYLLIWLHSRGHASVCLASTASPAVPTVTPPPVFLFDVPSYKTTFLIAWGFSAVCCFWEGAVTWDFHLTWLCCYLWKCPEAAASGLPIVTQGQKLDLHFFVFVFVFSRQGFSV